MLLIWSRWRALAVLIVAIVSIAVGAAAQLTLTALGLPQLAFPASSIGLFAAAAANWLIGKRMNATPRRELVDPARGERVTLTRSHRLFWIRMEYWSIPMAPLALVPLLALPSAFKG